MKIGSLCTGYGGLDMAVEAVFDAKTVWLSEIDISRSQQLKMLGNGVVPQQAEYAIQQLLK